MKPEDAIYERAGPTLALPRAADLELFVPRQGERFFERSPFEIEVSLGEQELRNDDGFGFSLRFRRVILALILERCELVREGRYERTLPAEEFAEYLKRIVDRSRFAKGQTAAGSSRLLSSVLSTLGIDLSVRAEIAASLERGDIQTIESKIIFKIVGFVAGARWEIGHPELGDPSEIDGLLRGMYLNKPADGRAGEEYNPLCFVSPVGRYPYAVTVELRAKKSDCVYLPLGEEPGGQAWEKRNKLGIERLVALAMLKELNRSDSLEPPDDEVILARAKLSVKAQRRQKKETR